MLQAADLEEDLLSGDIVTADGRHNLADAITEFEHGETDARLLDILCCEGCIMGAGFSCEEPVFKRRSDVSRETRSRRDCFDQATWDAAIAEYRDIDLSRTFAPFDQRFDDMPTAEELREILARMNKSSAEDELDCGACGYESCRDHAVAIWQGLAEVEMCLPYAVEELRKTVDELQESHRSLETHQGGPGQEREARQHGPARRRHRPRGQQPSRHPAAARQPAARGLRGATRRWPTMSS